MLLCVYVYKCVYGEGMNVHNVRILYVSDMSVYVITYVTEISFLSTGNIRYGKTLADVC